MLGVFCSAQYSIFSLYEKGITTNIKYSGPQNSTRRGSECNRCAVFGSIIATFYLSVGSSTSAPISKFVSVATGPNYTCFGPTSRRMWLCIASGIVDIERPGFAVSELTFNPM